jgi:hypothetical protein
MQRGADCKLLNNEGKSAQEVAKDKETKKCIKTCYVELLEEKNKTLEKKIEKIEVLEEKNKKLENSQKKMADKLLKWIPQEKEIDMTKSVINYGNSKKEEIKVKRGSW